MGASFRKLDQIVRLAGCDLLTISPDLLQQMEKTQGEVERCLRVGTRLAPSAQAVKSKHIICGISFGCKRGDEDDPFSGDKGLVQIWLPLRWAACRALRRASAMA